MQQGALAVALGAPCPEHGACAQAEANAASSPSTDIFLLDDVELLTDQAAGCPRPGAFKKAKCLSFADPVALLPRSGPVAKVYQVAGTFVRAAAQAGLDTSSPAAAQQLACALEKAGLNATVVRPGSSLPGQGRAAAHGRLHVGSSSPYIIVRASGLQVDLIVDPALKSHFALGGRTNGDYAARLDALPEVFVGTRAQLAALVCEMASAISLQFSSQGVPVPLWRTRRVLLQHWGLRDDDDGLATTSSASGRGTTNGMQPPPMRDAVAEVNAALVIPTVGQAPRSRRPSSSSSEASDNLSVSPDSVLLRSAPVAASRMTVQLKAGMQDQQAQRREQERDAQDGAFLQTDACTTTPTSDPTDAWRIVYGFDIKH